MKIYFWSKRFVNNAWQIDLNKLNCADSYRNQTAYVAGLCGLHRFKLAKKAFSLPCNTNTMRLMYSSTNSALVLKRFAAVYLLLMANNNSPMQFSSVVGC